MAQNFWGTKYMDVDLENVLLFMNDRHLYSQAKMRYAIFVKDHLG